MKESEKVLQPVGPYRRQEVDLVEVVKKIWRGRFFIVLLTFIAAVLSVVISLGLPNIYRSDALLAPAPETQDAVSGMASKYGGFASLAGINLGGLGKSSVDRTTITLEIMQSRAFITHFIRSHALVVPLMAAEGWDFETGSWIINPEVFDENRKEWVRAVSHPYRPEPSDLEIYEKFSEEILEVSQDSTTSLITLSVNSMSPTAAKDWATWLIEDVNSVIRKRDIEEATKSIDYLERQLKETVVAEMQQIFYQLIEQETKKIMLAKVQQEYALEVIDPPVVPEKKEAPRRSIIVIATVILVFMLSVILVLIKEAIFPREKQTQNTPEI